MPATLPPQPTRSTIIEREQAPRQGWTGMITAPWMDWFRALTTKLQQVPTVVRSVSLTGQSAAIAPTPFPIGALPAGLYRVSWYLRITQPATVSSSVSVTIGWNDGIALSLTGPALASNAITSVQADSVLIHIGGSTPITYATTYASSGATVMQYALLLSLESVA